MVRHRTRPSAPTESRQSFGGLSGVRAHDTDVAADWSRRRECPRPVGILRGSAIERPRAVCCLRSRADGLRPRVPHVTRLASGVR